MKEFFEKYNIILDDKQMAQLELYYQEILDTNKVINLTTIIERKDVWIKHFLDSLLSASEIPFGAKVIDIGTGAGFPGIPLKILRPDIDITLVDSMNKRVKFLEKVCSKLNILANVIHARAEDLAQSKNREKYDVCVARAVSPLVTLSEYTLPFIKVGGTLLAYKGMNASTEVNGALFAISVMGGYYMKENIFILPEEMGTRSIVVIKKVEHTPIMYPRSQNLPRLKPLVR